LGRKSLAETFLKKEASAFVISLEDTERVEVLKRAMGKSGGSAARKGIPTGSTIHSRLRHLERENQRLKAQVDKGIQAHVARSRQIDEILRRAQQADLCFLVDCTGSMQPYIEEVKDKIHAVVTALKRTSRKLDLRLSFVGYRDFGDGKDRVRTLPFTRNVDDFTAFARKEKAKGGDDAPEDVFGGLDAVLGLEWEADTRVLIHIADCPCHGSRFQPAGMLDDHELDGEGKDENGLSAEGLISRLFPIGIAYYFFHVLRSKTEKMIKEFNKIASRWCHVIVEADLNETATMLKKLTVYSVTRSIADSAQVLSKQEGHGNRLEGISEEDACELISAPPNWQRIKQELTSAAWYDPPRSIDAIRAGMRLRKINGMIRMKVAPNPFSEGHMRRAFHAKCVEGKPGIPKDLVVKKLKNDVDASSTACDEQMEIQCIAKYLAQRFSSRLRSKDHKSPKVEFLMVWSIHMGERETPYYANMEPFMTGTFEKFNNNLGYVSGCHDVLQAFSHWTHYVTKGYLIVVDLQGWKAGSDYILTDPAIHCTELVRSSPYVGAQFGDTNLGQEGMNQFFATHECNSVCRALGLSRNKVMDAALAD